MKFDYCIGNPPYQEEDGGAGASARPVYDKFVQAAKQISNEGFSLIMPARWYAGGKGIDDFRKEMLCDNHLKSLHDYPQTNDVFPKVNIRGGVCVLNWKSDYDNTYNGVNVVTHNGDTKVLYQRPLKRSDLDIFIRYSEAVKVLDKVSPFLENNSFMQIVSTRKPFGLSTDFTKSKEYHKNKNNLKMPIVCLGKAKQVGYIERDEIKVHLEWIDRYKLFVSSANNIGTELKDDNLNAFLGKPQEVCTESYMVIAGDMNAEVYELENIIKYLKTKFARFLHSIAKSSHHAPIKTYKFIPLQDFSTNSDVDWSKSINEIDQYLYKKYDLSEEEINFIEKNVKEMK